MKLFTLISAVVVAYLIYHMLSVMQANISTVFAHIGG